MSVDRTVFPANYGVRRRFARTSVCLELCCCSRFPCCRRCPCGRALRARESVQMLSPPRLQEMHGFSPPIFKVPTIDHAGDNDIVEVSFAESETMDGVEVTVIFKDEDRPNRCADCFYDVIRLPLFGRQCDIETFTVLRGPAGVFDRIHFEGTYSGDQDWSAQVPRHMTAVVPVSEFELESESGRLVIWINVWNHLFGPRNNNPDMTFDTVDSFLLTRGLRREVDARFVGLLNRVA
uniref:Uncharacterized protein n=1 Tax=Noctiluca scintillans TaxID=2966 RepID=A0A7S1FCG1_NOCSC|mmetsp:Transcript_53045/g.141821  ORF Transcript_53045/g.141821 Transcript_53045/m.141821 type:complete len:236 (+) Transcript_53045:39-746(+)